jgi:hypothetical protein
MVYVKAKSKCIGDKSLRVGRCLPVLTALYVSFRRVLISRNSFMSIANSMSVLCSTSGLSYGLCACSLLALYVQKLVFYIMIRVILLIGYLRATVCQFTCNIWNHGNMQSYCHVLVYLSFFSVFIEMWLADFYSNTFTCLPAVVCSGG